MSDGDRLDWRLTWIILAVLTVMLTFVVGVQVGMKVQRDRLVTEHICSTPAHNDDQVWHCWDEVK